RKDDRGPVRGRDDFFRREPVRSHLFRIHSDDDAALIASKRRGRGDAGEGGEDRPHAVEGDVLHLARASVGARQHELRHGNAAGVVRMMKGGTAPGGMKALERFTYPTTSAIAWLMSVSGWKTSFMSETPWMFFDSTCSMPVM